MDAVMRPFPRDQTLAPNKQKIKNPKKNIRSKFISNPCEGLLNHPRPLHPNPHAHYAFLLSSSSSYQQNHQPPLLPLPTASPIQHHPSLSPSPRNPKNTTRNMSLTPKKSKPTMRDEVNKRATQSLSEFLIPKHLPVVLASSSSRSTTMTRNGFGTENDIGMSSDSVFNILSPPPSSVPLPKFCVRSKLSCNTETGGGGGGGDAGTTDDLRKILRLP